MKSNFFWLFPIIVIFSAILAYGCKILAIRLNLFIDRPNQRSSHVSPVPRSGGMAIFLLFILSAFLFGAFSDPKYFGLVLGGIIIAVVGIMDDLIGLKSRMKIFGMVSASLIPILFGIHLKYLGLVMNNQFILVGLTLVWIYGMINAFNFMDGIDGLIVGVSVIFSFFLIAFSLLVGNPFIFAVSLVLTASLLGLLFFNYSPASIFLGDIGSMFLGYNFAVLSILVVNQSKGNIPIYVFAILFSAIIYDAMVTFIRRGLQGKNVLEAHREHLYQRLIIMGYSHRNVSLLYYLICSLFGVAALLFTKISLLQGRLIIFLSAFAILLGFSGVVGVMERTKEHE